MKRGRPAKAAGRPYGRTVANGAQVPIQFGEEETSRIVDYLRRGDKPATIAKQFPLRSVLSVKNKIKDLRKAAKKGEIDLSLYGEVRTSTSWRSFVLFPSLLIFLYILIYYKIFFPSRFSFVDLPP